MPHAIDAPRPARGGPRLRRLRRPRLLPAPPFRAAARRPVRSPAPLRPALVRAALAALAAALVLVAAIPAVAPAQASHAPAVGTDARTLVARRGFGRRFRRGPLRPRPRPPPPSPP